MVQLIDLSLLGAMLLAVTQFVEMLGEMQAGVVRSDHEQQAFPLGVFHEPLAPARTDLAGGRLEGGNIGQLALDEILGPLVLMPSLDQRVCALRQVDQIVLLGFRQAGNPGGVLADGAECVADG